MRKYELLYILKPDLEEEQLAALQEKVAGIITQQGGQTEDVKEWGKRRLNYEIANYREGYYIEIHFDGTPEVILELERVIKITDGILRHIIVRIEE
jgi:small subunit ribosomal protein S6